VHLRVVGFTVAVTLGCTALCRANRSTALLAKCCSVDQMKWNVMVGECSMYGRQERCIQGFGGET